MSALTTCPNRDSLKQFAQGSMPRADRMSMQLHLSQCNTCRAALKELNSAAEASPSPTSPRKEARFPEASRWHEQPTNQRSGGNSTDGDMPNQPKDPLGQYEIIEVLGRGGMGIVLKAHDSMLRRIVAIKFLGPTLTQNVMARKRFMREAQSAAAVSHENVVTVYGVGGFDAEPYLVMEFVDGIPLDEYLYEQGPLSIEEIVDLGSQIARGLAVAHAKGLIHRDIKPANILLEKETNRVKITDFGLARAADDSSLTRSGEVCGTPHYMAPEQAAGEDIDHRVDLFSLGTVLYLMCTGQQPFAATNSMAVLRKICEDEPAPLAQCNGDIPQWLSDLISRLQAKNPDDRVQTAEEVAQALQNHGVTAATKPVRKITPRVEEPTHRERQPTSPDDTRRDRPDTNIKITRQQKWVYAAVIALAFVAALPAFYFLAPRNQGIAAEPKTAGNGTAPNVQVEPPTTVVPVQANPTAAKPQNQNQQPPKQPRAAAAATGKVIVSVNDQKVEPFLLNDGIRVRHKATQKTYRLRQATYDMPVGDYDVPQQFLPPFSQIRPSTFTVQPDQAINVQLYLPPPPFGQFAPPPIGQRSQGERPSFPPSKSKNKSLYYVPRR